MDKYKISNAPIDLPRSPFVVMSNMLNSAKSTRVLFSSNESFVYLVIILGSLLSLLPYFLGETIKDDEGNFPNYVYSINNIEAQAGLVANIAAALPIYLDNILDSIYSVRKSSFSSFIPNRMMMLVVTIPDLIILTVVIPNNQFDFLIVMMQARDTILSCAFLIYLNKLAPTQFRWQSICFIGSSFIAGNVLLTNSYFSKNELFLRNFRNIYYPVVLTAVAELIRSYGKWFIHLYTMRKKPFSNQDYICSIYATVYSMFILLQWGVAEIPMLEHNPLWTSIIGVHYFTLYTFSVFISITCIQILTTRLAKQEVSDVSNSLQARKAFTRYISHEIRTPLNIVKAGLKVLEEDLEKGVGRNDLKETILDIASSCAIAVDTLSEMLTYDKVESNNMVLEREDINVERFMIDSLRPFFLQAKAKCIHLKMMVSPGLQFSLLYLSGDESKLAQVIRNLISNALKFTPTDGLVIVKLSVEERNEGVVGGVKYFRADVTDSGAGMSEENQGKLFKGIVQFHAGKLQSGGGTGLGLYISKGIVELHGGDIKVFSAGEGFGSTFSLLLPLISDGKLRRRNNDGTDAAMSPSKQRNSTTERQFVQIFRSASMTKKIVPFDESEETMDHKDSLEGRKFDNRKDMSIDKYNFKVKDKNEDTARDFVESFSERSLKINSPTALELSRRVSLKKLNVPKLLIVDDSEINRKMMSRLMVDRCDVFEHSNDGLNAVIKVKEGMNNDIHYDVILMDYHMPGMDGPDAARAIRELGYTGLIIGLTGDGGEEDTRHFLSLGANHVLLKPLDTNSFDTIVMEYTTRKSRDNH